MTTYTSGAPTPLADPTLRIPNISADLLPAEIGEKRQHRRTRRRAIVLLTLAALAAIGAYVLLVIANAAANVQLNDLHDQVNAVRKDQAKYAELTNTQARTTSIDQQLKQLMGSDAQVSSLMTRLRGAAPGTISLDTVTVTLTPAVAGQPAQSAARIPDNSGRKLIGTITIGGTGRSNNDVTTFVSGLSGVTGIANPTLDSVTRDDSRKATFAAHMDITDAVLGGRFSKTGGQ